MELLILTTMCMSRKVYELKFKKKTHFYPAHQDESRNGN